VHSYGEEWLEIIEELRSTSSKIAKLEILKRNNDVEGWKDFLVATYNPFITYGE